MLDKGKELDWFNSSEIVALAVVAAVGLAVFVVWELTDEHPVVDLRLFANRNCAWGVVTIALWESRAVLHHAHLSEQLQPGHPAFAGALAALTGAGLSDSAALAQITRQIDQQAYTRAADDIFLISAWAFLVLIGLIWMIRRPPRLPAHKVDGGGAH